MLASYPISRLYETIERKIKLEIEQMIFENHSRRPTKEEYEDYFNMVINSIECVVLDIDLGIFHD